MKDAVRRSSRISHRREKFGNHAVKGQSKRDTKEMARPTKSRSRSRASSEERAPNRNVQEIPAAPVDITPKLRKRYRPNGEVVDSFCWLCHNLCIKEEDEIICDNCPRVYHTNCVKKLKVIIEEKNFCDCHCFNVDGRKQKFMWSPADLKPLLAVALNEGLKEEKKNSQKLEPPEKSKFYKYFKNWPQIPENVVLVNIIDIDVLIDKMNMAPPYQSTGHFFSDVKWIYHNSYIVYGEESEITETALKLEKHFKQEMIDIEACRECYRNKHDKTVSSNFFTYLCRKPHPIVWAKIRGSPFWPAKCLKILNDHADVRFFGTHDKANILLRSVYKYAKVPPDNKKGRSQLKYRMAIAEVEEYIDNYEHKYGLFQYFEKRTPLDDSCSTSLKKQQKKGKPKGSSENLEKDNPDDTMMNVTTEKRKDVKGIKLLGNAQKSFLAPLYSDDSVDRKVEAFLHSSSESSLTPEGNENVNISMTFTAENMNSTDDVMDHYSSTSSLSESQSRKILSLNETLEAIRSTETISMNSQPKHAVDPVGMREDSFRGDVNTSNTFPVITSAQSAVKDASNLEFVTPSSESYSTLTSTASNFGDPCSSKSVPVEISKTAKKVAELAKMINVIGSNESKENEDDIEIVRDTRGTGPKIEIGNKNKSERAALNEMFLSNRPNLRRIFKDLQSEMINQFIRGHLELNNSEQQTYEEVIGIYNKLMLEIQCHKLKNTELQIEIKNLKDKMKTYEDKEYKKDCLRDLIVNASLNASNDDKSKIQNLEQKVAELNEKLKESSAELAKKNEEIAMLNMLENSQGKMEHHSKETQTDVPDNIKGNLESQSYCNFQSSSETFLSSEQLPNFPHADPSNVQLNYVEAAQQVYVHQSGPITTTITDTKIVLSENNLAMVPPVVLMPVQVPQTNQKPTCPSSQDKKIQEKAESSISSGVSNLPKRKLNPQVKSVSRNKRRKKDNNL